MATIEEFVQQVAGDVGCVLLMGNEEPRRRAVAEQIHAARQKPNAAFVVISSSPDAMRLGSPAPEATVYIEDAAALSFTEQEELLANSRSPTPWKVIAGAEAREDLHDAVSEERLRPAVYHLLNSHFFDFDKNLSAVGKPR